jgi:hypothetical protein
MKSGELRSKRKVCSHTGCNNTTLIEVLQIIYRQKIVSPFYKNLSDFLGLLQNFVTVPFLERLTNLLKMRTVPGTVRIFL